MMDQLSVEEYDSILSEALESQVLRHKRVLRYDGVFKHIIFIEKEKGWIWKRKIKETVAEIEFESGKLLGTEFTFEIDGNYHTLDLKRGQMINCRFASDKDWGNRLEIRICDEENADRIIDAIKIIATDLGETIRVQYSKGKYRNYGPSF